MSDEQQPPSHRSDGQAPVPSATGAMFAVIFVGATIFNLVWDAMHADYSNPTITIFLGSATLLILGVDVGRIIGRR